MSRIFAALAVFLLALVIAPRAARADGEDVGLSWADCVIAPSSDADLDGLDDACEHAVAARFQPQMVFGTEETATGRLPFWASRPDGYRTMRIFYALSYFVDAGDPTFGGASGHDGDTEFMVLRVHNTSGTTWELVDGYLSAHYDTLCDSGGWYTYDQFEYVTAYRGQPVVYIAEGKHANYVNLDDCDNGGCFQDHCSDVLREDVGIAAARDLGLLFQQRIDEDVELGNHEWFWTDVIFCGWQRPPGDARDGCVPAGNTYAIELTAFEMLYGPVGSTPLCGPCVDTTECADGGVCMPFDGELVCGRECGGAACPTGSSCTTLATGESQCVPDLACSCVLACDGKQCGSDGCGGTCGTCPASQACDASGQCVSGTGMACAACPTGTECAPGLACATSDDGQRTYCVAACGAGCTEGFACGEVDGGDYCLPAAAPACHDGDVWSVDACGNAITLEKACNGAACSDGACACVPACDGKACGADDGCGHPCGACTDGSGAEGSCACTAAGAGAGDAPGAALLAAIALALRRRCARTRRRDSVDS